MHLYKTTNYTIQYRVTYSDTYYVTHKYCLYAYHITHTYTYTHAHATHKHYTLITYTPTGVEHPDIGPALLPLGGWVGIQVDNAE